MPKYDDDLIKFDDDEIQFDDDQISFNAPEISQTETALRSGLQGATLGFGDELAGLAGAAVKSPLDSIMQHIPGTPQATDKDLRDQGFTGDVEQKSILDQYKESRDMVRADNKASAEANPNTALGAEILGGIAPALLSGGGTALAGAGKLGLGQLAKQGAKEGLKFGAAQAAGVSEAEDVSGLAKDTLVGGALGAGMGAALPVGLGAIKKSSSRMQELLKKAGKGLYDKNSLVRYVTEATNSALKGLTVVGDESVSEAKKAGLNKMAKFISNTTKSNRKDANKMITEALEEGDEGTRKLIQKIMDEQLEEIDKVMVKASSEEGKAGAQAFKNELKALKAKQLKEGVDPSVLDLPTESEALDLLKKRQTQQMAEQSPDMLLKKAEMQLQNKLARKGDVPEDTLLGLDKPILPKDAERNVLTAVTPEEQIGRQLIKPGKLSPIEKVAVDDSQFLRYDLDGQVKAQQFQPKDILKDEPPKVQEFFDMVQNFKEALPEGGNVSAELADIQQNLSRQIVDALPVEKAKLLESGFDRLNEIHNLRSKLGKDIGHQFDSKETAAINKLGDELEKVHGFDYAARKEGQKQTFEGLESFGKLNKSGNKLKDRITSASKRLELSKAGQGESNIKFSGVAGVGVHVGSTAGHILRNLKEAPKSMINAAAKKAGLAGDTSTSNFLSNLVEKKPQAKAAAIFSASQNPELRKSLEKYIGINDEQETIELPPMDINVK